MGFLSNLLHGDDGVHNAEDISVGMPLSEISHLLKTHHAKRDDVRASDDLSMSEEARAAIKQVEAAVRETYEIPNTPRWGMAGRTTVDVGHDDRVIGFAWFPQPLDVHTPSEAGAALSKLEEKFGPGELDEDATDDDKMWVWRSDVVVRIFSYTWDDLNQTADISYSEREP